MTNEEQEFERIRAAVESATDVLAGAIDKHTGGKWDYLIVAVPTLSAVTRVAMMTSVPADTIAHFLGYLRMQMKTPDVPKVIEVNGVPEGTKPS